MTKNQLLEKAQDLLWKWIDNIFGDEVRNECFSLSFEVKKEAASERIQRYVTSEEYLLRADLEDEEGEEDSCEIIPPGELAETAMINAFDRGYIEGDIFVIPLGEGSAHCENWDELRITLQSIYRVCWYYFVEYKDAEPVERPDVDEAWQSFLEDFSLETGATFKKLGWVDAGA